ncbi:MOSC domain-containing protein [Bosea rubneri]|uniref:Molybdenum cofactor sulfurase n=1 Tax=Bosea rubneri TaxID=3075434 RepID=A0ABU3S4Y2_9HYPH|nr:MOSC domain-containing protein [Bosea sp. ZW T0_25]MDU0339838.1 molybdenum cofactor sulfurase [Bosea sp. ZW T0_25]
MTAVLASGRLVAVLQAARPDRSDAGFVTSPADHLDLDHHGIPGDRHHGATRRAGAREPWLPRGTVLRNDRQLSALCPDELAEIAASLAIEALLPQWIGGNLAVEGLPGFSQIAPGSRLAIGGAWGGRGRFDGKAVLRVEAYNSPCRLSGRAIAAATGRPELEFSFVKAAARLRGVVLSVDLPGRIAPGDAVVVLKPMQG